MNGLEIDLDELEVLEQRVKAKKSLQDKQEPPPPQTEDQDQEVDELDEYLKELQLREATAAATSPNNEQSVIRAPQNPPINFAILLYWFLAILNLANATYCKHGSLWN